MMIKGTSMKKIFTFKGQKFGYRIINGCVHNINISSEVDKELAKLLNRAEYYDIPDDDKKILVREKMELCHDYEVR